MPEGHETVDPHLDTQSADELHLAKLGYKQELARTWSGFSNFAISFSIISILAGCLTTFYVGWNNGGPAAIAWGWPIVSVFILIVGFCMAELVSAYPTSGGIYWWASKLGGPMAGFYTGWLNLIGLLAIDASVAYGCAGFFDTFVGLFSDSWAANYSLTRVFIEFAIILVLAGLINVFSSHLLALINNVSVWWHVAGAAIIVIMLWFFTADGTSHASVGDVFASGVNNTGFFHGHTGGIGFLLYVLPMAGILTQYTITGYDASVHLSEETQGAANSAAKGIWQSILFSAIGGWILLLSLLFAVQSKDDLTAGGGGIFVLLGQAFTPHTEAIIVFISACAQFFCTCACMTSTSRMFFAFSRDGAVPGSRIWSKLNAHKVPVYGVIASVVIALVITLPALIKVDINGAPSPIAFYAVVSIGVIGLYLAFAIPIFLRWKKGDAFEAGAWNLGGKYRWMCLVAVAEIVVMSIVGLLPTASVGMPGMDGFSMKFVNYAIIVLPAALILLTVYWFASVRHWFTGPISNLDTPPSSAPDDLLPEPA
ncbi:amino acid permease [Nocardioides sp. Kera G14]|uniref:amino acid permease n=1 Tax=Nocardioides sp. Kera G14 TaxID=2884264 RepID=UPI001D126535|nr:amino acid permease [Nocardioides sp. Kera G14]UDY25146.1 amino acid permease [Nocardioides sp. Kera G14]